MSDEINRLIYHPDAESGDDTSQEAIQGIAARFGVVLPRDLLRLWQGDTIVLDRVNAHIPGPMEVLEIVSGNGWPEEFMDRGYLPLLDDHESNFVVLTVREPLAYRVAWVPHDDQSRILYRDLKGFAAGLLQALDHDEMASLFFHETQGDYPPDGPRTAEDSEAARTLLMTDGELGEWNDAIQLLSEDDLAEWARLLETDHFVRRDALSRLRVMRSAPIQDLLQQDRREFGQFCKAVTEACKSAGLEVGERRNHVLLIEKTGIGLEGFFYRRNIPDAMPRIIAWIQDLIAGRNPHHRPNHFLSDETAS